MSRDWTQEYFGITDNTPVSNTESNLRRKLEIAVNALEEITASKGDEDTEDCKIRGYLYISHCLKKTYIAQEALEKIKEIK